MFYTVRFMRKMFIIAFIISLPFLLLFILNSSKISKLSDCKINKDFIFNEVNSNCLERVFLTKIKENRFSDIVLEIKEIERNFPPFSGFCHAVTHKVGLNTIGYYKSFIEAIKDTTHSICGEGLIHGVMLSILSEKPNDIAFYKEITDLCIKLSDQEMILGCGHGFGHGITEISDPKTGIKICEDLYKNFYSESNNILVNTFFYNCGFGVIMQGYAPAIKIKDAKLYPLDSIVEVCKGDLSIVRSEPYYLGCSSAVGFSFGTRFVSTLDSNKINPFLLSYTYKAKKDDFLKFLDSCYQLDSNILPSTYSSSNFGCYGQINKELLQTTVNRILLESRNEKNLINEYNKYCGVIKNQIEKFFEVSDLFCSEMVKERSSKDIYNRYIEINR